MRARRHPFRARRRLPRPPDSDPRARITRRSSGLAADNRTAVGISVMSFSRRESRARDRRIQGQFGRRPPRLRQPCGAALGMNDFEFSTLETPLFLGGCIGSCAVLGLIWYADLKAAQQEKPTHHDFYQHRNVVRPATRIRIGADPILSLGQGKELRLINPSFLLVEIMGREPFSVLPVTFGWFCLLLGEPVWAAMSISGGLVWRAIVDLFILSPAWLGDKKGSSVALKLAWVLATGVWLASLLYLFIAALLVLLVAVAFLASGTGKKRRSKW